MKKTRKILAMMACAVLLVCISVGATVAYLTSTDAVTNTFVVGSVGLFLDEAQVSALGTDGKFIDDDDKTVEAIEDARRVSGNEYKLFPGHTYDKDPTVHVDENSEKCYVFVKVENGISDLEASTNNITSQITANGWVALDGVTNVYYKAVSKDDSTPVTDNAGQDYQVFRTFTIDGQANTVEEDPNDDGDPEGYKWQDATIVITAYAVQADGFDTPAAAWNATFGAPVAGE